MRYLQPCSVIIASVAERAKPMAVYDSAILEARARRMSTLGCLSVRLEECKAELAELQANPLCDAARVASLRRIVANLDGLLARENMRNVIIARTLTNKFQH